MAIREFKCLKCNEEFEFMKIKSEDKAKCPKCGASSDDDLRPMFPTGTSHILKGKGWFKNGY